MAEMWFQVLGPVRVWRDDAEVDLGAPQQRTLLALLLVRAGHPVGLAEIVDVLWGEHPPASAVNAVHRGVGLLRRALEPGLTARDTGRWLVRAAGGYRLDVDAGTFDLLRFRLLTEQGRRAEALDLWPAPVASTIAHEVRVHPVFTALDREYEAAVRAAVDDALAAGEPRAVLRAVEQAADRAPLDESLQARLILVLAGTGQRAAALVRYEKVRARLAEELGIDPGTELAQARDQVLRRTAPHPPGSCARCGAVPVPTSPGLRSRSPR